MRRLTRRIGLFGGPGSLMPTVGVNKKPDRSSHDVPELEAPSETSAPRSGDPRQSRTPFPGSDGSGARRAAAYPPPCSELLLVARPRRDRLV